MHNNNQSTLIDHIWTSNPSVYKSGIFDVGITDHLPNFSFYEIDHDKNVNDVKLVRFRNYSIANKEKFGYEVSLIDWQELLCHDNVDVNANLFVSNIQLVFDRCFPICQKQFTKKRLNNPWLTSEVHRYQ